MSTAAAAARLAIANAVHAAKKEIRCWIELKVN